MMLAKDSIIEACRMMGYPNIEAKIQEEKEFQDFFGFLDLFGEEETEKKWLREPKNLFLLELFVAERLARRGGKRKTMDTHSFEQNLFENLISLRDALWNLKYEPSRGTLHIITDPVQREIFAAPYVDRILHHWVVGIIMKWKDQRLIYDSYSCRKNKGTLEGVKRLQHHILSVSHNFKDEAYVMQLDLSGYFMHIQKEILLQQVEKDIKAQFPPKTRDKRYQILRYAMKRIIMDDPRTGARLQGHYRDWRKLPENKSLVMQPNNQGIVIGNFTSQTFSNIYLNGLDWFMKNVLGWKHYGRYVDDFYVVVTKEQLPKMKRDVKAIENYLAGYGILLNRKKTKITEVHNGVKFLGVIVKGFRLFPGPRIVRNFRRTAYLVAAGEESFDKIVSYLGIFSHYDAGKILKSVFDDLGWEYQFDKKRLI